MNSIWAYIRVDVSGYLGNDGYPGLRNSDVAGYPGIKWRFICFSAYFMIFLNFKYMFVGFGISQQGGAELEGPTPS